MPSHLQGLNLVHPHPPQTEVDSQDLLAGSHFPDLTAQLALWTNLPFESEESPVLSHEDTFRKSPSSEDDEEEKRGVAPHDSHVNVVTGTNIGTSEQPQQSQPHSSALPQQQHQPPFDFNALLHGFGLNAFPQQQQQPDPLQTPSLAQLLALHSLTQNASLYQQQHSPPQQQRPVPPPEKSSNRSVGSSSDISPPPAKRARARKPSVSVSDSPSDAGDTTASAVAAAEDKRRRNTAASARFRLKKKEREYALETKARELEIRVNELERECEGLRRENGWLKGLVVGVTGAAQNNVQQQHNPQSPPTLAGIRRPREDD
ncbi:hypothetical protein L218DRAFT_964922 [Marasmius fiardii PR-910]|nr:hypothetical protein L218DRAFT_964922 [Marasmius fiardii PR-910]